VDDMERAWQWLFTIGNGMLCTCGHIRPVPKTTDPAPGACHVQYRHRADCHSATAGTRTTTADSRTPIPDRPMPGRFVDVVEHAQILRLLKHRHGKRALGSTETFRAAWPVQPLLPLPAAHLPRPARPRTCTACCVTVPTI
jgi:hypothetical protein